MKIEQLIFSKEDLEKVPETERILFVQFSMLLTDINIFRKLSLYSAKQKPSDNEVLRTANIQISFNLICILCAKLYEGWNLIDLRKGYERNPANESYKDYFYPKNWFQREYRSRLGSQGEENLRQLESYFINHQNNIRTIRDNYSSHYDYKAIKTHLESLTTPGTIVFGSEKQVDTMFSNASKIFMYGFLDMIDPENRITALNKFLDGEVKQVSKSFVILAVIYLRIISNTYLRDVQEKIMEVPDPEPTDNIFSNFFKDQVS